MDKYKLVEKKTQEPSKENEIRVAAQAHVSKLISDGLRILQEGDKTVLIRGMGNAIHKAIKITEIIKRRLAGLHQITDVHSVSVIDVYEPVEEGLDIVKFEKHLACISITLSSSPLDTTHKGYQSPISQELIDQYSKTNRRKQNRQIRSDENKEQFQKDGKSGRAQNNRGKGSRRGPRKSSRMQVENTQTKDNQEAKLNETSQKQERRQDSRVQKNSGQQKDQENQGNQRNSSGQRNTGNASGPRSQRYSSGKTSQDGQQGGQRNLDYQPRGQRYPNRPRNQNTQGGERYSSGQRNQDYQGGQRYSNGPRNQNTEGGQRNLDYQPRGQRYSNGPRNQNTQGGQRYSSGQRNQDYQGGQQYSSGPRNQNTQGGQRYSNGPRNQNTQGGQRYSNGPRYQNTQYGGNSSQTVGSLRNRVNSGRPIRGTIPPKENNE